MGVAGTFAPYQRRVSWISAASAGSAPRQLDQRRVSGIQRRVN
jgi:hypothetical protein